MVVESIWIEKCDELTERLKKTEREVSSLRAKNIELASQNSSLRWEMDRLKAIQDVLQNTMERLEDLRY
jgi:regulator of replication initiation timing